MTLPLPLMHRVAGKPVLVMGEADLVAPKRRFVERAGGVPVADLPRAMAAGARLAFIGLSDHAAARDAAEAARAAGMLVNVVDRPELCDFTTPAVIDRDPVVVAIGTGGASAGLAKHLRLRLEALLPPTLGPLASCLEQARGALRRRFPDGAERRRALDAALEEGGPLDPFAADSADVVARWLAASGRPEPDEPIVISLVSSDPDDLTLRQARLLGRADVVLHEPGVPDPILRRARADARLEPWTATGDRNHAGGLVVVLRAPRATQAASASTGANPLK